MIKKENISLLLVDDEDHFRQVLSKRLKKRGIYTEQASNGHDCLAIIERKHIDVVVLDVKMKGMNGIETLHKIKTQFPRIEVILLTGHVLTADGVSGIKSGAFDYLSKPIEFEHLLSKIMQAYDKILRDEEKLKEAEFRNKMEQNMIATERLASLGTLSAGVAHEINNPIAIINESVGWIRLLIERKELKNMPYKEDIEKALGKIEKGIDRTKKITHQLLETVRKNNSVLTEVNLKKLVEETADLIGKEINNKQIAFGYEIDSSIETIWSDPYLLRQVLINLFTNAIHATPPGGKITLKIVPDKDCVTLLFSDTGEGIPKENLEKIFEPFFSTKDPGEGTGLGLFVTRNIIDKLGGTIELNSKLGHGTYIHIILPKQYHTENKKNT